MKRFSATRLILFTCLLAGALPAAAADVISLHVASRAFIVSVAPVDEESRNAENSILYQRANEREEWAELGLCKKNALPGGDIRFTREVAVEDDGRYLYTSRPVVGGVVSSPPTASSPAQAVVVVDTLPPLAEILSPAEGAEASPGETVVITWTSSDENLAPGPAALGYSTDGGVSWVMIEADLDAKGTLDWTAPENLAGPAVIRLAVLDMAGNIGRDVKDLELAVVTPPPIPVATPDLPPPESVQTPPPEQPEKTVAPAVHNSQRSWLYYLMAINLMRQNKPADALQYYWLSVKEDPDFINAWADMGLAYIDLGAYKTAREVAEQARDKAPERIDLMHLMGETYHAEGMARLTEANSAEARMHAKGLIDKAVHWYGLALEKAAKEWRLAEQAPSYYRLGEVCYYVNMDRDGARAYWRKIMELHSPTPNSDLILWSPESERDRAKQRHQRYTYQRVSLESWQNWARGYLEQLDVRERAGIMDLMPAQRITAIPTPQPLAYAGNAMNPGRDDGRSLFSLPAQLGSPGETAAVVGYSCSETPAPVGASGGGAMTYRSQPAENYSFYAPKNDAGNHERPAAGRQRRGNGSVFSGGPDAPAPPNPDPYAFPQRGRTPVEWNNAGPYGNQPVRGW